MLGHHPQDRQNLIHQQTPGRPDLRAFPAINLGCLKLGGEFYWHWLLDTWHFLPDCCIRPDGTDLFSVVTDRQDQTRWWICRVSRNSCPRTREDQPRGNLAGQSNLCALSFLGFYTYDKTLTNNNLGREGFTWLPFPSLSPSLGEARAGTQCRNLEAGTEAEARREPCLLTVSTWLRSLISYAIHSLVPRDVSS